MISATVLQRLTVRYRQSRNLLGIARICGTGQCMRPIYHVRHIETRYRGKGLGGSSGINFLCWTKPPRQDIDGQNTELP